MYTFESYQEDARETAQYIGAGEGTEGAINYCVLGLAGEVGEIANFYKKRVRAGVEVSEADAAKLADELGDVLWYAANLAYELGFDLSDVALLNRDKLRERSSAGRIKKLD